MTLKVEEANRPDGDVAETRVFAYFGGKRYEQIRCDCSCAMPCPQGKTGSSTRCTIWVDA